MRAQTLKSLCICAAAMAPSLARAQGAPMTAPSFSDLELSYPSDAHLAKAEALLGASVPPGTPVAAAEARLQSAGATCRPDRRTPGLVQCLYHDYDLSDGAADDIRWTVALHVAGGDVSGLSVSRYVDRHGTD